MNKPVLITGATGQDGIHLSQLLDNLGYEVYGLVSGQNDEKKRKLKNIVPNINIIHGDLRDLSSLINALKISKAEQVYNLGAVSSVGLSWTQPELVAEVTGLGALRMLEAIKISDREIKFFQASSSEMFGYNPVFPQLEISKTMPNSPYGIAKDFAHKTTINYRKSFGMFACTGILYNHSSPLRSKEFVTKKIANGVVNISKGIQKKILLGNIDDKNDWGYAVDYVDAMYKIMNHSIPDDFIVCTGVPHTIRDYLDIAFNLVGINDWSEYVDFDPSLVRPSKTTQLTGTYEKINKELGWEPKTSFKEFVKIMIDSELNNE